MDEARLLIAKPEELPLSGPALLELMTGVLGREVPFRFRARGWSMAPFVRDGDVITVSPCQGARPRVGDVVAFARPNEGNLVVHRVVARRGPDCLIMGDAVGHSNDGIIPSELLLGRVTRIERDGRDVWLGLGPERTLIAWLSRRRWLMPLRAWVAAHVTPLVRRLR